MDGPSTDVPILKTIALVRAFKRIVARGSCLSRLMSHTIHTAARVSTFVVMHGMDMYATELQMAIPPAAITNMP